MSYDYFTNLIDSTSEYIEKKRQQNKELSEQEQQKKDALNEQSWLTYYLKKAYRSSLAKMNNFLTENGGMFALNDEQKAKYLEMMQESNSIHTKMGTSRELKYSLAQNVTSLSNRIFSNNLTIFNTTLDVGEYTNQQALYNHMTQGLG